MSRLLKKIVRKINNRLCIYTRISSEEFIEQLRLGGDKNWRERQFSISGTYIN